MKINSMLITVVIFTLSIIGGFSDEVQSIKLTEKYVLIENHLSQFKKNTNYNHLIQAYRLTRSITQTNQQMGQYLFEIRLRLLESCQQIKDKQWNMSTSKRPAMVVAPPFVPGETVWPGMDPNQIKDSNARKKYELDINENERLKDISRREISLQRTIEQCMFDIKIYLKSITNMKDQTSITHAKDSINKYIKDKSLSDSLNNEIPKISIS